MSEGAPVCRWVYKQWLKVDIMSSDGTIMGFTNKWYREGIEKSIKLETPLPEVKIFPFSYFLATKLEAFQGRGHEDYLGSHDMEDIISILEVGEKEVIKASLIRASKGLKDYLKKKLSDLLNNEDFKDALPGAVFNRLNPAEGAKNVIDNIEFILKDIEG